MLKKLIALAGITALSGLGSAVMVSGCTTEEVVPADGDSGTATDAGRRDATPAGDGGATAEICPSPAPTEDPPYKAAQNRQTTCKANIGAYIEAYIDANASATFKDLENAIAADTANTGGAPCATCIFTTEDGASWGPIVYAGDGSSGGAFFNYGSCFEKAPGGSAACGKAIQSSEFCIDSVCSDEDCGSENAKTQCVQTTLADTETGCGRFDVQGGCGSAIQSLNTLCGSGIDVIKVMCAQAGDAGANTGG